MWRQGFAHRLLASLIDGVILFAVCFMIGRVSSARLFLIEEPLVFLAYGAMEVIRAQSVGKMALGLTITRRDGSSADSKMLMKRFAVKYAAPMVGLAYALLPVAPLNFLQALAGLVVLAGCCLALRLDRLAMHDIIAHTAVFGPQRLAVKFPGLPGRSPHPAAAVS